MTHDSQSTPITPEGLRGLGFTADTDRPCWWNLDIGPRCYVGVFAGDHQHTGSITIDANPSEWEGPGVCLPLLDADELRRLIEVLRRMNGGGA